MDDAEDETFVTIGNALPPYEEDEVPKKPVPIQDQVVRDDRGRVRFHGAFTGGFSAGYFNTVGSKEGWAPSTFVSSRDKRAEKSALQKPEDFMDAEDLGEHGIAPRMVSTTSQFTSAERNKKRLAEASTEELLFSQIVLPSSVSMGLRLLKRLGWKEGQGVGAKVRKAKKKTVELPAGVKMYGCALPPGGDGGDSSEVSDDETGEFVKFAPKDVTPVTFDSKDNLHGIGYKGLDPHTALGHVNLFDEPQKVGTRKGMSGKGFGTGALEEEDEDIYALDRMGNYDYELPTQQEVLRGLDGQKKNRGKPHQKVRSSSAIEGYVLSKEPTRPKKVFPPPHLPKDFRPYHINPRKAIPTEPKTDPAARTKMDASTRREMLGENPEIKSVMDLITDADKSRLSNLKSSLNTNTHNTTTSITTSSTTQSSSIITTSISTNTLTATSTCTTTSTPSASSITSSILHDTPTHSTFAGGSFKPFASDPEKQARYEQFLHKGKQTDDQLADSSMTEWERVKEREEFLRASSLYRPLSAVMATRFTSAKHRDDDDTVEVPAQSKGNQTEQQKAVEMKMFGKLTRETYEWHPDRLVCKRFNVANPYPESQIVGVPRVKREKFSVFNFLQLTGGSNDGGSDKTNTVEEQPPAPTPPLPSKQGGLQKAKPLAILATVDLRSTSVTKPSQTQEQTAAPDVEAETTDADPKESDTKPSSRPDMDLFKAIFEASGSEDSESSEEDSSPDPPKPSSPQPTTLIPTPHIIHGQSVHADNRLGGSDADSGMDCDEDQEKETDSDDGMFGPEPPPPSSHSAAMSGNLYLGGDRHRHKKAKHKGKSKKHKVKERKHKKSKKRKHGKGS